jgi:hypothetical protein
VRKAELIWEKEVMQLERAKQVVLEELLAPIPNPEKEAREEDT